MRKMKILCSLYPEKLEDMYAEWLTMHNVVITDMQFSVSPLGMIAGMRLQYTLAIFYIEQAAELTEALRETYVKTRIEDAIEDMNEYKVSTGAL